MKKYKNIQLLQRDFLYHLWLRQWKIRHFDSVYERNFANFMRFFYLLGTVKIQLYALVLLENETELRVKIL